MKAFNQIVKTGEAIGKTAQNFIPAVIESDPELTNEVAGSTHVLGDIFEFTDYMTPCSRISRKFEVAWRSLRDDSYAELFSF